MTKPDLSAEALWEVVKPVWEKHPKTRPSGEWAHWLEHLGTAVTISDDWVGSCEARMIRWLCNRDEGVSIWKNVDGWNIALDSEGEHPNDYPTLLHALAAACMEVPV